MRSNWPIRASLPGGHLIRDRRESLARLKTELAGVRPAAGRAAGGDDRRRTGTGAPGRFGGAWHYAGTAQRLVCRYGAAQRGSLEGLLQRLDVLRALAREGRLPFGRAAAERYLMDYAAQGYPPLSHSQAYRAAYRPAYRVVEAGLLPDP